MRVKMIEGSKTTGKLNHSETRGSMQNLQIQVNTNLRTILEPKI